jgi:Spy/CpxP family protein refolding chaperone
MIKTRTALGIAILLAILLPLTMVAQSDAPPSHPQQGQEMGEHHGHMGGPPSPQAHLDMLSRMVNLTDDQKAKIKPILENTDAQAKSLRQDTSLSPQERRTKMRDLHESTMSQIRAQLTPEQQSKLDEMKKNHEGMGHGKGMGHGDGMGKPDSQQKTPPPQQ